jgi:predicted nucleic-acid-binding Zn-ribbon protein
MNMKPLRKQKVQQPLVGTADHPGFAKLTSFETPPDGIPFSAEEMKQFNPSPDVLNAAAQLSPDDLTHLFIDTVGSFEVTHPQYRSPGPEVVAVAEPALTAFFRRIGGVDEIMAKHVRCKACGWTGQPPELKFHYGDTCPKCGSDEVEVEEAASPVESQAKQVVENALGHARGQSGLSEHVQQIMRANSAAVIYNIIQNFRHEDQLNYLKVATALDDLEKKLENHKIGTHAFVEQAHTIIHRSGLLPHA